MLKIYNTLSHKVEEFIPIKQGLVYMYTCGPTVYDMPHIGNLRSFIFSDILQRVLKLNGLKVELAENITDIDDKIIKKAKEKNQTIFEVADEYSNYFLRDIQKLNILKPSFQPKATDYIEKMAEYIRALINNGYAYKENDGSVYFDISKFSNYGKLSGLEKRELKSGTRMLSDEYTKDNVQDFALWKAVPEGEVGSFKTILGWGRPGWHIECSVMSQTLLGKQIDLHTGGVDLIFPHHENEIAQSESYTGESPFVRYWVHGAHILVDGKKMSKSLHNFYTLSDLEEKGVDPLALRYLYLQTHYRQEMNFTWEALGGAHTALNKLRNHYLEEKNGEENHEILSNFLEICNDDLNLPKALGLIWENINKLNKTDINKLDEVLGLNLSDYKKEEIKYPEKVQKMLEKREALRKEKKFNEADKIRDDIIKMGYEVEDN